MGRERCEFQISYMVLVVRFDLWQVRTGRDNVVKLARRVTNNRLKALPHVRAFVYRRCEAYSTDPLDLIHQ